MRYEKDPKALKDLWHNADIVLIFTCWIISTFQGNMEYVLASKAYFILLSISFVLLSYKRRFSHWLVYAFFELSIYNVFDEIVGSEDSFTWYEIPIIIFSIIHSWYKFKKSDRNRGD